MQRFLRQLVLERRLSSLERRFEASYGRPWRERLAIAEAAERIRTKLGYGPFFNDVRL